MWETCGFHVGIGCFGPELMESTRFLHRDLFLLVYFPALWTFGRRPSSRLVVLSALGCLDGLTVAASERMSGFGLVTAWRPPVVLRPTPVRLVLSIVWDSYPCQLTSACVLLPVLREVVVSTVAFVARVLVACRVGHMVHAALPHGVGHLSHRRQGCLACALGLGCCSLYRLVALSCYVPCKSPFGNTTVGLNFC